MKKSFILSLLLALCCSLQCWAEFNPTPGKMYALKEVTSGLYLDIQTLGINEPNANATTNNISLNEKPCLIYFEAGATAGTWRLKNTNGSYAAQASARNWNAVISSTSYDWIIAEPETNVFTIARADGKFINVDTKSAGQPLYCDKDSGMQFGLELIGKNISGAGSPSSVGVQDISGRWTTVPEGTAWTISMDVENPNGASYNDWGTSIFAIGSNAFPEKQGYKGIQFYLQSLLIHCQICSYAYSSNRPKGRGYIYHKLSNNYFYTQN